MPADRFFSATSTARAALEERVRQRSEEGEVSPLYLAGRVGGQSVSLHSENGRLILVGEDGSRHEVAPALPAGAQPTSRSAAHEPEALDPDPPMPAPADPEAPVPEGGPAGAGPWTDPPAPGGRPQPGEEVAVQPEQDAASWAVLLPDAAGDDEPHAPPLELELVEDDRWQAPTAAGLSAAPPQTEPAPETPPASKPAPPEPAPEASPASEPAPPDPHPGPKAEPPEAAAGDSPLDQVMRDLWSIFGDDEGGDR